MSYCPWCRKDFEQELFCENCGKPLALKAQPVIRTMINAGNMPERWVATTQKRLISTVYQQHQKQVMEGLQNTAGEAKEFASSERSRMLQQKDELKERFEEYKRQAENGRYAPEQYIER